MAEVIPASRAKGDSYSDDDDNSMGSDASSENNDDEQEVTHPPPKVVEDAMELYNRLKILHC